ncbi:hypothetical protein ACIBG7_26870 [Nonomuraea sp. NPDC050328]|uniref:hypothetical protein n=1 Tax=Nonomuraea sp. NPDC050328 TaxID=3364361 RepID=UPI0037B6ABEA
MWLTFGVEDLDIQRIGLACDRVNAAVGPHVRPYTSAMAQVFVATRALAVISPGRAGSRVG